MEGKKKFYLTKKGLEKLKEEFEKLKKLRVLKTKGEIPHAWQSEDLNPEYLLFQEDWNLFESRFAELDYILKNAELIQLPKKEDRDVVNLGATVTLEDEEGQLNEFMIVETLEANPSEGKISLESPVGKSLLGKKIGEEVVITSPIRVVYKIKKIKYQIS
jgi:transcription elongation factor GreA